MASIFLYNSLTRKKEEFAAINPPKVGIYACGPTVYDFAHIGHMRRYVGDDILRRVLKIKGFEITYVMNITDVGHLTSDADTGEDKVEAAAKKTGKSAWEIAEFFENQFFTSTDSLNIQRPDTLSKATDHIKEQIEMIGEIEENGFTYKTEDGIYFDTAKLKDYGKLTGGKEGIKPGVRIKEGEKKHPTDFALWKFSPSDAKRQMEWDSPWGKGFPGWHIECSAMSRKYLGETFDIHTGGVDHIAIHHTNEIAQSEGATGKIPARFWLHHEFLQIDGGKMAKSLGNTYTVEDVVKKGFDPLSLRYLFLTAHYRDRLNFTWDTLKGAQTSLKNLYSLISGLKGQGRKTLSSEKNEKIASFREEFETNLFDDLNTAKALATLWEMLKSNLPSSDKYDLALSFDEVLGLNLAEATKPVEIPEKVKKLMEKREELRRQGKFDEADRAREEIIEEGFSLEDTPEGVKIKPQ